MKSIELNYSDRADRPPPAFCFEKAVGRLASWRLPVTFPDAASYLQNLSAGANLLDMYRHYFPDEFERSQASSLAPRPSPAAAYNYRHQSHDRVEFDRYHSPKELEFLELVENRLFPLGFGPGTGPQEERVDAIPVFNIGIDWWMEPLSELLPGWQFLLLVAGNVEAGVDVDLLDIDETVREVLTRSGISAVDWEQLEIICRGAAEPLCYLPLAIELLNHETGNIYLDASDEMPADPLDWCREDVDFLIEQYRQALEIRDKTQRLVDWLEAGAANLKEAIELWNQSSAR